jgi:hypothetical protein
MFAATSDCAPLLVCRLKLMQMLLWLCFSLVGMAFYRKKWKGIKGVSIAKS